MLVKFNRKKGQKLISIKMKLASQSFISIPRYVYKFVSCIFTFCFVKNLMQAIHLKSDDIYNAYVEMKTTCTFIIVKIDYSIAEVFFNFLTAALSCLVRRGCIFLIQSKISNYNYI